MRRIMNIKMNVRADTNVKAAKGGGETGNEDDSMRNCKTIKEAVGYIVTQYPRWKKNEDDWPRGNEVGRTSFQISKTNGE